MELYVRSLSGATVVLKNISDSTTVSELKQKIFDKKAELSLPGINSIEKLNPILPISNNNPKRFQMTSDFNSRTLGDVGVRDRTTIHVVGRVSGKGGLRKSRRSNRKNNRKSRRSKSRR